MGKYYITEAFKEFNILDEAAEEFALNPEGFNDMVSFIDQVGEDDDIEIVDLQAEAEDELQDSYNGKVILQCKICKSDVFEDKDNIEISDDGLVNASSECPYCQSNDGYNIIGQVSPFKPDAEFEEPSVDNDISIDDENEEGITESLKRVPYSKKARRLKEDRADGYEIDDYPDSDRVDRVKYDLMSTTDGFLTKVIDSKDARRHVRDWDAMLKKKSTPHKGEYYLLGDDKDKPLDLDGKPLLGGPTRGFSPRRKRFNRIPRRLENVKNESYELPRYRGNEQVGFRYNGH